MKTSDFDFELPRELIALRPVQERASSRLLVLDRSDGSLRHSRFSDLPGYMNPGDLLLLNRTKVFPARLVGTREDGQVMDILLVRNTGGDEWEILSRGGYTGALRISDTLMADISDGRRAVLRGEGDVTGLARRFGSMPLPPYIRREPDDEDRERYQTVYARDEGSIAAPTAGLHFTDKVLSALGNKGVEVLYLTLHVGVGTFRPVRSEEVSGHNMDSESFEIPGTVLKRIEDLRAAGGRLFTVGTTTTRALEGFLGGVYRELPPENGSYRGETDIFIYPGFRFRAVDALITNFHLPRSTPLMLASAFAGVENIRKAYGIAVSMEYRFFSYGDAMLIL